MQPGCEGIVKQYICTDSMRMPLEDNSVHMIITSPPYYNAKDYSSWPSYDLYLDDMDVAIGEMYRVLVDGGRLAMNVPQGYDRPGNGGYKTLEADLLNFVKLHGFIMRGHIVWDKMGISPQGNGTAWGSWKSPSNPALRDVHESIIVAHKGDGKMPKTGDETIERDDFLMWTKSIWSFPPQSSSWHPAPFPPELPRRLIHLYTYTNAIVLDPFCGSGTTVKVADELGRIGVGFDLKEGYLHKADEERIRLDYWMRDKPVKVVGKIDDLPMFIERSVSSDRTNIDDD